MTQYQFNMFAKYVDCKLQLVIDNEADADKTLELSRSNEEYDYCLTSDLEGRNDINIVKTFGKFSVITYKESEFEFDW